MCQEALYIKKSPLCQFHVFCVRFVPLEYITTKPAHSKYVVVSVVKIERKSIDVYIRTLNVAAI